MFSRQILINIHAIRAHSARLQPPHATQVKTAANDAQIEEQRTVVGTLLASQATLQRGLDAMRQDNERLQARSRSRALRCAKRHTHRSCRAA
jgi:hypothetical protein